jgi:hypothetical protein
MNCTATRNLLLGSERLDPPPGEASAHLARCADCQDWWQRLVHLEERVCRLPVPSSPRKEVLVRRFREATPRPSNGRDVLHFPPAHGPSAPTARRPRLKERGQRKLAVAFALAATLAAFAVGMWFWPQQSLTPPTRPASLDPLARRRADRDRRLREAAGPREKVRQLALLVEELQGEVRRHSTDPAHLDELARFYREVVCEDLLKHARKLSPAARVEILPAVTERLRQGESDASRLAARFPASEEPLLQIARAAREGERLLHELET